jgi:hypothetical protein
VPRMMEKEEEDGGGGGGGRNELRVRVVKRSS